MCAIKAESKLTNRNRIDNQASSLLQNINVITNLLIMRTIFLSEYKTYITLNKTVFISILMF